MVYGEPMGSACGPANKALRAGGRFRVAEARFAKRAGAVYITSITRGAAPERLRGR